MKKALCRLLAFLTVFSFIEYANIVFDFSITGKDVSPVEVQAASQYVRCPNCNSQNYVNMDAAATCSNCGAHIHTNVCYAGASKHVHSTGSGVSTASSSGTQGGCYQIYNYYTGCIEKNGGTPPTRVTNPEASEWEEYSCYEYRLIYSTGRYTTDRTWTNRFQAKYCDPYTYYIVFGEPYSESGVGQYRGMYLDVVKKIYCQSCGKYHYDESWGGEEWLTNGAASNPVSLAYRKKEITDDFNDADNWPQRCPYCGDYTCVKSRSTITITDYQSTSQRSPWNQVTSQSNDYSCYEKSLWTRDSLAPDKSNLFYGIERGICPYCGDDRGPIGSHCFDSSYVYYTPSCGKNTTSYYDDITGQEVTAPRCASIATALTSKFVSENGAKWDSFRGAYVLDPSFDASSMGVATSVTWLNGTTSSNVAVKLYDENGNSVTPAQIMTRYNRIQTITVKAGDYPGTTTSFKVYINGYFNLASEVNSADMGTLSVTGTLGTGTYAGKYLATYNVSVKANPKSGYRVKGWIKYNTDNNAKETFGSVNPLSFTMPANNVKVVCEFEPITYTVKYSTGTSQTFSNTTIKYRESFPSLPTPTRDGYIFLGWKYNGNYIYTGTILDSTPGSSTITLAAEWVKKVTSINVVYDDLVGPLQNPRRTGYVFQGWATSELNKNGYWTKVSTELRNNSVNEKVTDTTVVKLTDNTTLHARWNPTKTTITFDANGGTITSSSCINGVTYINSGKATKEVYFNQRVGTMPTATRSGQTFVKWAYSATDTSAMVHSGTIWENPSANVTLYAVWQAPITPEPTQPGATPTPTPYVQVNIYPNYPKSGDRGNGTPVYSFTVLPNKILSALSNVRSRLNSSYLSTNTLMNEPIQLQFYTEPDVSGYSYDVYSLAPNVSTLNLYMRWKHALHYEPNTKDTNKNNLLSTVQGVMEDEILINADANFTVSSPMFYATGYTFDSWNTKADGTGTKYLPGSTLTSYSNTTLYAQWTRNAYTVTLDARGGRFNASDDRVSFMSSYDSKPKTSTISMRYGEAFKSQVAVPKKLGYAFMGYYTGINGTGSKIYDEDGNFVYRASASNFKMLSSNGVQLGTTTSESKHASNKVISVLELDRLYAKWLYTGAYRTTPIKAEQEIPDADVTQKVEHTEVAISGKLTDTYYDPYGRIPSTETMTAEADAPSYVIEYCYSTSGGTEKHNVSYTIKNGQNSAANPVVFKYQTIDPATEELTWASAEYGNTYVINKYVQFKAIHDIAIFFPSSMVVQSNEELFSDNTANFADLVAQFTITRNLKDADNAPYDLYQYQDISFKIYRDRTDAAANVITINPDQYFYIATSASGVPVTTTQTLTFNNYTKEQLIDVILYNLCVVGTKGKSDVSIMGNIPTKKVSEPETITLIPTVKNDNYPINYQMTYRRCDYQIMPGQSSSGKLGDTITGSMIGDENGSLKVHTPVAVDITSSTVVSGDAVGDIILDNLIKTFTVTPYNRFTHLSAAGYGLNDYVYSSSSRLLLAMLKDAVDGKDYIGNTVTFAVDVWADKTGDGMSADDYYYPAGTNIPIGLGRSFYVPSSTPIGAHTIGLAAVSVNSERSVVYKLWEGDLTFADSKNTQMHANTKTDDKATYKAYDAAWYYYKSAINGFEAYYTDCNYDDNEATLNDYAVSSGITLPANSIMLKRGYSADFRIFTSGGFMTDSAYIEVIPKYELVDENFNVIDTNPAVFFNPGNDAAQDYIRFFNEDTDEKTLEITSDKLAVSSAILRRTDNLFSSLSYFGRNTVSQRYTYSKLTLTKYARLLNTLSESLSIPSSMDSDDLSRSQQAWYFMFRVPGDTRVVKHDSEFLTWSREKQLQELIYGWDQSETSGYLKVTFTIYAYDDLFGTSQNGKTWKRLAYSPDFNIYYDLDAKMGDDFAPGGIVTR